MKKTLVMALMAGTALVLSGCQTPPPPECNQPTGPNSPFPPGDRQCTSPIITKPFEAGVHKSGPEIAGDVSLSQWKMSTLGSTVGLPTSGLYSVTLKGANGAVIDQASFSWGRNGNLVTPSNIAVVKNWLSYHNQQIYDVEVTTLPYQVTTHPGPNMLAMTTLYNNVPISVTAQVWTEPCNTGGGLGFVNAMICNN